jgi:hypothetical protein
VFRDEQPDTREGRSGRSGVTERLVLPMKPGNAGRGKGPWFRTDATRSEGAEIGQPSNSGKCSETADGVTRESEDGSRVSLLCAVRQDLSGRHSGPRLCPVPLEQRGAGSGRSGPLRYRGVRGGAVARGTGDCAQGGELPTGSDQKSVYPEAQRQVKTAGYLDSAGSGVHDSGDAGARPDL